MYARDANAHAPFPDPHAASDRAALEQQVRTLQERVAFYEGFDLLIHDNVAHARELFRMAAQEREAAAGAADLARQEEGAREAAYRAELEAIASDLAELAQAVSALAGRVARVLDESPPRWQPVLVREAPVARSVSVVVHGVPSARTALSLQRFTATLPQVADVSAREFSGGVLRLEAVVDERLQVGQFDDWESTWRIQPLTERPDVIEFALRD